MGTPSPPEGPSSRNAPTWVPRHFGAQPPEAPRAMDLRVAYSVAIRMERERPPLAGPGYRLYWMTAAHFASRDVLAAGPSQVVIGRHDACDAVLGGDALIALRHLLVRSTILDDGCPRLSVLDLQTDTGFLVGDGTLQRSICAVGPIALRVGAYAVVALPGGVTLPLELPVPVCERADGIVPPRDHPMTRSRITLLHGAAMLSERPTLALQSQPKPQARDYELTLTAASGKVSLYLSTRELERGLLIGRAHKCVDAGLRAILNIGISRVHLLLLRDPGLPQPECRAYDLASTQGTFQDGRPVRQATLEDDGMRLALGTSTGIALAWRRMTPGA